MLTILAMDMTAPHQRLSLVFIATSMEIVFAHAFLIRSFLFGVTGGCLLIGGVSQFHGSLKPVCQTWTLFSASSFVTGFYQMPISSVSCSHMNCCLQNILHINLHILYIIQFKTRQVKTFKNYKSPLSTSKVIKETRLNYWMNLF